MTVPRYYITQKISEDASHIIVTDASITHQIKKVLRRKEGSEIVVFDGSGFEYLCVISSLSFSQVELEIIKKIQNTNESKQSIVLFQSIIKKDKMEWVFEKCTEIGISVFTPVLAEHSVKLRINHERSLHIIQEASEQSRRGKIPILNEMVSLAEAISHSVSDSAALHIVAHNQGDYKHITNVLINKKDNYPIHLFIGPEGGFSEAEIALFQKHNFIFVSLGKTTLRSETAAVAASLFTVSYYYEK